MQWLDLLNAAPLLPSPDVQRWGWVITWALVLAGAAAWAGQRLHRRMRVVLVVAVVLSTLWPGPASPVYWLVLAFQGPSLTSAVLCGAWLARRAFQSSGVQSGLAAPPLTLGWLWALGVVLGWVLLGDTLAWWQPSVYAWGFSPAALVLVCLVLGLVWLAPRRSRQSPPLIHLLALTLVLFVATRLPSGNLWDALLDPWLWVLLQWEVFARYVIARRVPVAIRAGTTTAAVSTRSIK